MSDENIIYDCEYIRSLVDEYLHDELSEDVKNAVDSHLLECKNGCKAFYDEEKDLTAIIKTSGYIVEPDFSVGIIEKIINEKITIQKPARKRPIPFGLISAAVIVLIMFIANPNMLNKDINTAKNSSRDIGNEMKMQMEADAETEMEINDSVIVLPDTQMFSAYYSDLDEDNEDTEDAGEVYLADTFQGEVGDAVVETPEPAAAPAVFGLYAEVPVVEESAYQDIPVPTGPFSVHQVVLIICVKIDSINDDVRNLIEQIETAEKDKDSASIIYMSKEYQEAVIEVLDKNGVRYDYRQGKEDAEDIAIFFY